MTKSRSGTSGNRCNRSVGETKSAGIEEKGDISHPEELLDGLTTDLDGEILLQGEACSRCSFKTTYSSALRDHIEEQHDLQNFDSADKGKSDWYKNVEQDPVHTGNEASWMPEQQGDKIDDAASDEECYWPKPKRIKLDYEERLWRFQMSREKEKSMKKKTFMGPNKSMEAETFLEKNKSLSNIKTSERSKKYMDTKTSIARKKSVDTQESTEMKMALDNSRHEDFEVEEEDLNLHLSLDDDELGMHESSNDAQNSNDSFDGLKIKQKHGIEPSKQSDHKVVPPNKVINIQPVILFQGYACTICSFRTTAAILMQFHERDNHQEKSEDKATEKANVDPTEKQENSGKGSGCLEGENEESIGLKNLSQDGSLGVEQETNGDTQAVNNSKMSEEQEQNGENDVRQINDHHKDDFLSLNKTNILEKVGNVREDIEEEDTCLKKCDQVDLRSSILNNIGSDSEESFSVETYSAPFKMRRRGGLMKKMTGVGESKSSSKKTNSKHNSRVRNGLDMNEPSFNGQHDNQSVDVPTVAKQTSQVDGQNEDDGSFKIDGILAAEEADCDAENSAELEKREYEEGLHDDDFGDPWDMDENEYLPAAQQDQSNNPVQEDKEKLEINFDLSVNTDHEATKLDASKMKKQIPQKGQLNSTRESDHKVSNTPKRQLNMQRSSDVTEMAYNDSITNAYEGEIVMAASKSVAKKSTSKDYDKMSPGIRSDTQLNAVRTPKNVAKNIKSSLKYNDAAANKTTPAKRSRIDKLSLSAVDSFLTFSAKKSGADKRQL